MNRDDVESAIARATVQPVKGKLVSLEKRDCLIRNISCLLSLRGDDSAVKEWNDFISALPTSEYPASENQCVLSQLKALCDNAVQHPPAKYISLGPVDAWC